MAFSPHGRGHQVLQTLQHDGWRHEELAPLIKTGPDWSHWREAHFLLLALKDAGLVRNVGDLTAITTAGRDALVDLDAGFEVHAQTAPKVQVFSRRAGEVANNPSPVGE